METGEHLSEARYPVSLTLAELDLLRTALEMLEDTLGRDEADELAEVQDLLGRLPRPQPVT